MTNVARYCAAIARIASCRIKILINIVFCRSPRTVDEYKVTSLKQFDVFYLINNNGKIMGSALEHNIFTGGFVF